MIMNKTEKFIREQNRNDLALQKYKLIAPLLNEDLDSYFRSKSWYQPTVSGSDFTEEYAASVFNDFERTNIDTIVKYEQAHNINQF